jgi:RNA polymerase primary sigma factor
LKTSTLITPTMNASMTFRTDVTRTTTPGGLSCSNGAFRSRSSQPDATASRSARAYESADAFHLYLREIGSLPLLTREEEISLARRARRKDAAAREALIKGNLRLVVKIARDYENMGLPLLDLIAEGNVGLMKAVDRFDPERGTKLSVYASFWIKQSVRRALGNYSRTIRVPIHVHGKLVGLERVSRRLQELLGRAPTDAELAHEAGVPAARLAKLRLAVFTQTSLDAPVGETQDASWADVVPDEQAGTPYDHLAGETLRELLREFLGELNEREAYVLRLRYGLDDAEELTLDEVGVRLKLTRERVRQIQAAAIKKLNRWITRREEIARNEVNRLGPVTSCLPLASV